MSLSLSGTFSCDSSRFSCDGAPDDTGWESPSDSGGDAVFGAQYGDRLPSRRRSFAGAGTNLSIGRLSDGHLSLERACKSATVSRVSSRLLAPTQSSQAKSRSLNHRRAAEDGGTVGREPFSTSSQPRRTKAGATAAGAARGTPTDLNERVHAPVCSPPRGKVSVEKAAQNAAKGGQRGQGRRLSDASENLALKLAKHRQGLGVVGAGDPKTGAGGASATPHVPRGGRVGSRGGAAALPVSRSALAADRKPLVAGSAGNVAQSRVVAGEVKPRQRLADGKGPPSGSGGRIPAHGAPDGGKGLREHSAGGSVSGKGKNEKRVVGTIGVGNGGRGVSAEQRTKKRGEEQEATPHTEPSRGSRRSGRRVAAKGPRGCDQSRAEDGSAHHPAIRTAPRAQHTPSHQHPTPPPPHPDQLPLVTQPTGNQSISQTSFTLPPSLLPLPLTFPSPSPSSAGSAEDADMPWAELIGDVRGMEQDVQYVRHAMLAAGFLSDALPPLFSPYLPINPAFFQHLEAAFLMRCCAHATHDPSHLTASLPSLPLAIPASYHEERRQRMLLFDAVNEALGRRLAPFLPRAPWSPEPVQVAPRRRPVGMELVQEVWSEIHSWPVASTDEVYTVLDESARRDLWRGTERWRAQDVAEEEPGVVFDVEGMLLEELLEEVCLEFVEVEQRRASKRMSVHGVVKAQITSSGFVCAAHVKGSGRDGVVALLGPACPTAGVQQAGGQPGVPGAPRGAQQAGGQLGVPGAPQGVQQAGGQPRVPGAPQGVQQAGGQPGVPGAPQGVQQAGGQPGVLGAPQGAQQAGGQPRVPGAPQGVQRAGGEPGVPGAPQGVQQAGGQPGVPGASQGVQQAGGQPRVPGAPQGVQQAGGQPRVPGAPQGAQQVGGQPRIPGAPQGEQQAGGQPGVTGAPRGEQQLGGQPGVTRAPQGEQRAGEQPGLTGAPQGVQLAGGQPKVPGEPQGMQQAGGQGVQQEGGQPRVPRAPQGEHQAEGQSGVTGAPQGVQQPGGQPRVPWAPQGAQQAGGRSMDDQEQQLEEWCRLLELDTPMATAEESEVDEEPPLPPSPCPCFPCDTCFHTFATRGGAANHMRVCRAAEAERRAQALGSIPSLVETDTQERSTPREFGDEAWAGVTSWEWETFFSVEAVGGRTVRRIPQRARSGVLDVLCCILKRLKSQPGDEAATLLLLAFPRLILAMPPKPGIGQKALITERLGAFWEGRWRELFDSAMAAARPAVRPLSYTRSDQDPDAIRLSRCRSRCRVGEWSRGLACLTAGELARPSEVMGQSLREKHPASAGEVPQWVRDFTIDTAQRPSLTTDILARAIHTAARASAAGPSGWVTEHLRDTFLTEPTCLSHLLEVFNQWVAGQVPERARPWLAASNLVGLSKPNGDVRPVAIGEVLPRILARALCISLRPAMVSYFLPCNQLGAGTRVGAEILTHSFRSALATHPDWCALQIDVANAFNSFHRNVMFDGLRESPFSGMIPFLRVFYGTPSDLYLRAGPFVQSLESARGSRQGDPLGPFLFAFTQQQVMEPITREFKDLLFLSYADDTYILGPAARILEAFGVLRERLEWVGLEVQAHKCRFWEREGEGVERALPLGMQGLEEGLTVVGVPI
ncbi:unnamed protein product [Closterium sp. NIES-65]|nr:unnamed protein product [Closterium sp. NIES-65]